MKRPLAYLTAAWSGEPDVDMELAAHYCRLAYEAGFSPICPLLYLPLFLNDSVPEEHKAGIDMRRDMLRRSHSPRQRNVHLHVMVTPDELAAIHERMTEAGISNAGAYVRKMALNGYILHIDLTPVKELISLQRRCSNNLNQVAVHAHTYGVYPEEIDGLKRDYEKLWGEVSKVLRELSELVAK